MQSGRVNSDPLLSGTETYLYIADDSALVRDRLRKIVEPMERVHTIGVAAEGITAIREILSLMPDIVILDLSLPAASGLEVLAEVKKHHPDIQVFIYTLERDTHFLEKAISLGADGYFIKSLEEERLFDRLMEYELVDMKESEP